MSRFPALALAALAVGAPCFGQEAPRIGLARISAPITVDGDPSEAAWGQATRVETFYETAFGDNRAPHVKTTAWLGYDDRFFYVAVRCADPEPGKIRAPFVDRDNVFRDQDNFAVFLDTRNDRRSAQEFRVNARGIQGDAVFNDANGDEDFSPDFYYDTAARVTPEGWMAEMRIPLSSLRYPKADPQTWGFILWRNYPRDFRYAIYSNPIPRGNNCYICNAGELRDIRSLPSTSHLVVAPYATAQDVARAEPGSPLADEPTDFEAGVDLKWTPFGDTALDATINPDFSQVEADVAQIGVNNRFALFFPEKRPFFLEGVDLFGTPIRAVYTRTITSPRWGARATGKIRSSSYTALVGQDAGGGSVILPGTTFSDLAPQDFRSLVGIARWRQDLGTSFVGLLYAGREVDGGGHNRVFGPDVQWRPSGADKVTAQLLWADTETPARPALAEEWDGRSLGGHALQAQWEHSTRTLNTFAQYQDFGNEFRADDGFIPQVGYRQGLAELGYNFYPKGVFNQLRPYVFGLYNTDRAGDLVNRRIGPGVNFQGRWNLQGFTGVNLDRVRTGDRLLDVRQLVGSAEMSLSRKVPIVALSFTFGEDVDLAGVRVGTGGDLTGRVTLRPTDHLDLQVTSARRWLGVDDGEDRGRLFTAQVQRLKATYNFNRRMFVRFIGQYVTTRRDPALFPFAVPRRDGEFAGSALLSYRLNWQTAVFLGYGDDRATDAREDLQRTGRQLFVKASYAFQR